MKCPFCSHSDTRVADSRESDDGWSIRRRRECESCQRRFTTYERHEERALIVVKKNGSRERFDRAKLMGGLLKACEKRPVSLEQMEKEAQAIETQLRQRAEGEFTSDVVGQLVMDSLLRLDQVAYVRFASVYKEFTDVSRFVEELKILQQATSVSEESAQGDA